ncbi:MAG: hypothetical protein M0P12_00775 [Paludibacteraceae bacterium]|nr:hypothetical protein [Paludibacteraceae bacterium]
MEIDPNIVIDRYILVMKANSVLLNSVISEFESRELSVLKGIRVTLPVSSFPSLEIESVNSESSWYATRVQRHMQNFRCVLTVLAPSVEDRESYQNRLTSAVTSIFKNPQNLQFPIPCVEGQYRYSAFVYDSFISSVQYSSTRDGFYGVSEWLWTVNIHEAIPDILFSCVPSQIPNILKPIIKEIGNA